MIVVCYSVKLNPSLIHSCWSDHLLPDLGKQDSHHFECHLVSRLPQVLLLYCVPLYQRWLHHCHPTCRQWHLPHSDLPPTWHHLQDWGGSCEEGRRSRWTEGKGHGEIHHRWCRWGMVKWDKHDIVLRLSSNTYSIMAAPTTPTTHLPPNCSPEAVACGKCGEGNMYRTIHATNTKCYTYTVCMWWKHTLEHFAHAAVYAMYATR